MATQFNASAIAQQAKEMRAHAIGQAKTAASPKERHRARTKANLLAFVIKNLQA